MRAADAASGSTVTASALPSPFKSPNPMKVTSFVPRTDPTAVLNVPSPFPRKTSTVSFTHVAVAGTQLSTTARSSLPSPLTSPNATAWGFTPAVDWFPTGAPKDPSPFPGRTFTDRVHVVASQLLVTTARSDLLSPLKSPKKTAEIPGKDELETDDTAWKVPSPFPRSTPTLDEPLTTSRSSLPSPFTSPASTEKAFPPEE